MLDKRTTWSRKEWWQEVGRLIVLAVMLHFFILLTASISPNRWFYFAGAAAATILGGLGILEPFMLARREQLPARSRALNWATVAFLAYLILGLPYSAYYHYVHPPPRFAEHAATRFPSGTYGSPELQDLARAWHSLPRGKVLFRTDRSMQQGSEHSVSVVIADSVRDDLLRQLDGSYTVDDIRISTIMAALLEGSGTDFEIQALSTTEQIPHDGKWEWRWLVIPLRRGTSKLFLRIVAKVDFAGKDLPADVLLRVAAVDIESNYGWMARRFLGEHWKYLLGSPILIALGGWLITRLRPAQPKRPAAGFKI